MNASQGFYISFGGSKWPSWVNGFGAMAFADVNGDGRKDMVITTGMGGGVTLPNGRVNAGAALVMYQPASGWPSWANFQYNSFKWDGTDSFQIYGPKTNSQCGGSPPFVADVRPGDNSAPEIIIPCWGGAEGTYGSVYGLYKNKGWPSSIDLNKLN